MTSEGSAALRLHRGCADQTPEPPPVDTGTTHPRRSALHQSRPRYVGLDVHQDWSAVASVAQDHGAEGPDLGAMNTRQGDLAPRVRKMPSKAPHLLCVYAAGPCGD